MQAALGIHQLKKLNKTISKRLHINNMIWEKLKNHKVVSIPIVPKKNLFSTLQMLYKTQF